MESPFVVSVSWPQQTKSTDLQTHDHHSSFARRFANRARFLIAIVFAAQLVSRQSPSCISPVCQIQARVLKRVQIERPDAAVEQKQLAADICGLLARHAKARENDLQLAIRYLKEALIYAEEDSKVSEPGRRRFEITRVVTFKN